MRKNKVIGSLKGYGVNVTILYMLRIVMIKFCEVENVC